MSYHESGATGVEESVCRYGASKLWFRGPKRALRVPYVACVGGTETFGRFVDSPFPAALEQRLEMQCLNLGSLFTGAEGLARDPEILSLMNGAEVCVLQLPSALNQSNRFYRVHPRRNDRVLQATSDLSALYPEVDFADVHFVRHLMSRLSAFSDARFEVVAAELRRAWAEALRTLLDNVTSRVLLLWLDWDHSPAVGLDARGVSDPVPITQAMIDGVSDGGVATVKMTVRPSGASDDLEDMLFGTMQQPMAEYMIGPATHRAIAERLLPAIRDLE
ncbi:DUF6473 family protein [Ruegeria arenilitoris]|uniref:DUF6473 family protein n=1 Tax=Ruegeria arenilitoris TaxID=1173585 RepID=UPI001C2C5D7E|nr:DUF6473 family protein [Ruegeria arenilitoris]